MTSAQPYDLTTANLARQDQMSRHAEAASLGERRRRYSLKMYEFHKNVWDDCRMGMDHPAASDASASQLSDADADGEPEHDGEHDVDPLSLAAPPQRTSSIDSGAPAAH